MKPILTILLMSVTFCAWSQHKATSAEVDFNNRVMLPCMNHFIIGGSSSLK